MWSRSMPETIISCAAILIMEDVTARADERFERALHESGGRDPRDFYRERLRSLRKEEPEAYERAVRYYHEQLIPRVAVEGSDPLDEWLEYGRYLAAMSAEGETVQIDPSGRSEPYCRPVASDRLVLHLPHSARHPALPVGIPPALSPAQDVTYDLLVRRAGR